MPQLVLPFGVEPAKGRDAFIVAPCNEQAFRFVESWPDWPARAAALHGPAGSGKSHLLSVWQARSKAMIVAAPGIDATVIESADAIGVEGMDDTGGDLEARDRALMSLFERRSGTLLLTGRSAPSQWPVALADLRSRFDSLIAFALRMPDDALLAGLVRKYFTDRQLEAGDAIVRRIVTHVERTPEAIAAFIARADAKAMAEKRAVTDRLVTELIEEEGEAR